MKIRTVLFVVSLVSADVHISQSGWSSPFKSFGAFQGKHIDPVANLNEVLEDSVDSDSLEANLQGIKGLIKTDEDVFDERTLFVARKFLRLEKVTAENICSIESIDIVRELIEIMKIYEPDSFELPDIKNQLNKVVANVAGRQLVKCANRFASDWDQVEKGEKFSNYSDLDHLTVALKAVYESQEPNDHSAVGANRWLIKQSNINLDESVYTRESVKLALTQILQKQSSANQAKDEDKNQTLKHLQSLLIKPCQSLVSQPEIMSLRKLLSVLISGNMQVNSLEVYYEPSETMDWVQKLLACYRLMEADTAKIVEHITNSS